MREHLLTRLNRIPLLDPHTHLDANHLSARGLHDILLYHMLISELYSAGCPSGDRLPENPDQALVDARIEEAIAYLPLIRNTPLYLAMRKILRDLYGWEQPLTKENWRSCDALIREKSADPQWPREIFRLANVRRACTELWRAGDGQYDDLLVYSLEWAFFYRGQWGCYDAPLWELEVAWSQDEPSPPLPVSGQRIVPEKTIRSVNDVKEALGHYCDAIPYDRIISTAQHISTDIAYVQVSDEEMERAIARRPHADRNDQNIYASYIFEHFLKAYGERCEGRPLVFSLGAEPLPYEAGVKLSPDTVFDLAGMLQRHPGIRFHGMLASTAHNQPLCSLARQFQNLSLMGYWWLSFFPSNIRQMIAERLEMLPLNKQLGFLSDAYCAEWMYAKAGIIRSQFAGVLADKVSEGLFSLDEALDIAQAVLHDSAQAYYAMDPACAPGDARLIDKAITRLNRGRTGVRGPSVRALYRYRVQTDKPPMVQLEQAAKMLLEHGTVKPWQQEGDARWQKPAGYDANMAWISGFRLNWHDAARGEECGEFAVEYPLAFFDKAGREGIPLAQLMMAVASEPFSAFSFYRGAKLLDLVFPEELQARFPGQAWPHRRVREYLGLDEAEPIIGTIVKPKAGLTPELFSSSVVEAALAGAQFVKADENLHLTLEEIPVYVGRTVSDLLAAGFDLGKGPPIQGKKRFLFAPHITANPEQMVPAARAAVEAGANALMFSPYYGGGFDLMGQLSRMFDVPVYAHTAGMNVTSGSSDWGIDASIYYRLAALFGAAFMQLTAVEGYLLPPDEDKPRILSRLKEEGLSGPEGMTLVIAGGLGADNIGKNMRALGVEGRMYLAGTKVYSHPDGAGAGVRAIRLASRAYREQGAVSPAQLAAYAAGLGEEGLPLTRALEG